jgi:hypothetical protein
MGRKMSLQIDRQDSFMRKALLVIEFAHEMGYQVTFGEAERTPEMAKIYASKGIGIANSKHCSRMALDLNFYKHGKLIDDKINLESIGMYAESLGLTWGGRFKKYDDSRHFEAK